MEETDWEILLDRIAEGGCTPFLGAGVNYGLLPLGKDVARAWSHEHHYPLAESEDLPKVAQYLAVRFREAIHVKRKMLQMLKSAPLPDCSAETLDVRLEPLSALAELRLPVYITTNYDDLMTRVLRRRGANPHKEVCRWRPELRKTESIFDSVEGFVPTADDPVVFHLHGSDDDPRSLVLTEDDYLSFLVNLAGRQKLLPQRIQEAMTASSLLFIGYSLADLSFRVLYQGLVLSMDRSLQLRNVAVQVPPDQNVANARSAREYLTDYFGNLNVAVYWGTAHEFVLELRDRWRRHGGIASSSAVR